MCQKDELFNPFFNQSYGVVCSMLWATIQSEMSGCTEVYNQVEIQIIRLSNECRSGMPQGNLVDNKSV